MPKHKDKIPGGLADDKQPSDFPSAQLEKGEKVELEHTRDEQMAREIAMDHHTEDPEYYEKLETIEASQKWASTTFSYAVHKVKPSLAMGKKLGDGDGFKTQREAEMAAEKQWKKLSEYPRFEQLYVKIYRDEPKRRVEVNGLNWT